IAGRAAPRQACAAIRRIVGRNYHPKWKQVLQAQIPLVDLSVAGLGGAQVVLVDISPFRQLSILHGLWLWHCSGRQVRKQIRQRGVLRDASIVREMNWGISPEGSSGVLEVRRRRNSVEHA